MPVRRSNSAGGRRPDTIMIEGRAYSWKRLCELRKAQLEAWRASLPTQPVLFDLVEDCRPKAERTSDGRYAEPTLLEWLRDTDG